MDMLFTLDWSWLIDHITVNPTTRIDGPVWRLKHAYLLITA